MTTIYLVRHGEYENPGYMFPGRSPGFPLSERGREQVTKLAAYFEDKNITMLYSSPILRTQQTADMLAHVLGIPVVVDDRLMEVRTMSEGESMNRFDETNGELSYTPKMYEKGAESMEELAVRMYNFMESVRAAHEGQEIVMVTHGDPIRFAAMKYMGMPLEFEASRSIKTPLAGGYRFDFPDEGNEAKVYPIVAT